MSVIAPHHCCGCDKIGFLICHNCKNDIVNEAQIICLNCRRPTVNIWLCSDCKVPYDKAWAVGEREGVLQRLIGDYKFQRARSAYKDLADLLIKTLPDLPASTVIVPVPTTSNHIRERGYDHMLLIAKRVAKAKGVNCQTLLHRATKTKQRQSNALQRNLQASQAFFAGKIVERERPYLLLDDVTTTGATIKYASKELVKAGAKNVWVAVIAYQKLG